MQQMQKMQNELHVCYLSPHVLLQEVKKIDENKLLNE